MPEQYRKEIIQQRRAFHPLILGGLCACLTIAASFLAYQWARTENLGRFERTAIGLSEAFKSRMTIYTNSLVYTRNLFEIKPDLSEAEFHAYVEGMDLPTSFPGIQNVGYIKYVTAAEMPALRAKYPPHFAQPLDRKSHHAVVVYVKSLTKVPTTARGMDLSMDPVRWEAMKKAAELGKPVATDRVLPLSVQNPSPSDTYFIVFVPHYKAGASLGTPEQRLGALAGFVYGGFRARSLFGEVGRDLAKRPGHLIMSVHDGEAVSADSVVFSLGDSREASPMYAKVLRFEAAEHTWTITLQATDRFTLPYARFYPWFTLLVGILLTAAVTYSARRADSFAEKLIEDIDQRLVAERQLREEKEILQLVARMGTSLKADQDLGHIVQMVTDVGTKLTKAKFGAFFYNSVDDHGDVLMLYTLSGAEMSDFAGFGMPRNTPVFRPTFEGTGVLRVDDITKDLRYGLMAPHFGMPKGHLPVRSYLSVPVISKNGKVLGGLFFGHPEPGVFTERAETIARTLALQAGVAMDNANLYRELDNANRAKSIFLANVSHEIRTPLGLMLGFAELSHENSHNPALVETYADKIVRNGRELTRIIGDVLDLSKIEANTFFVENTEVPLDRFLEELEAIWRPRAESKGLSFKLERSPETPARIHTDGTRLKQILVNLLSNATKFTEQGHVRLAVSLLPEKGEMLFLVEDTGPGIKEEHRDQLFKSFFQGDGSVTRKYGGSGLGLALSKQLAKALQGDLTLKESAGGTGTTFELRVPLVPPGYAAPAKAKSKVGDAPPSLEGVNVLLVEDSKDNQVLISLFLEKAKAKVETADNGEEGVRKALEGSHDIVLMDIQMPVLDGYRALAKLREAGFHKPVVALTAHALREEKEKAMASGFNDYLTKPVDRHLLVNTIHNSIG